MKPIALGTKGTAVTMVDDSNLAVTVKSGSLPIFSTPMMAALMEQAACNAIADALTEGETSVGTALEIQHTAPTPVGLTVTAEAEVTAVCGREISFQVTARDESGVIGEGNHRRFVVDVKKFMAKAQKRKELETTKGG